MGILDDAIREHLELKRRHGADSGEVSRQEREILGGGGEPLAQDASGGTDYDQTSEPAFTPEPIGEAPAPLPSEPLPGSPLTLQAPDSLQAADDIFPGTGELLAAASESSVAPRPPAPAPAAPATPAAPAPSLGAPAPTGADNETAARSGARRLSDDELAAWRRRLSERADRLAAQRPGTPDAPAAPTTPAPAAPKSEPPAYWSGNTTGADPGTPPPAATPRAATPRADTASHAAAPPESGVPVDFFEAGDAENAFAPEAAPEAQQPEGDVLDETPDFLEETPEHDRMWFEQRPPRDFDFG